MLPLPRNGIRELVATRIPASPGLGELTSQFLQELARNVDNYTPAEVARLATAALEVLATRLARELDVRDWGTPEARKHAMLTTVQGFICQHLSDLGCRRPRWPPRITCRCARCISCSTTRA